MFHLKKWEVVNIVYIVAFCAVAIGMLFVQHAHAQWSQDGNAVTVGWGGSGATYFPSGNVGYVSANPSQAPSSWGNVQHAANAGGTAFYSNGNGTYNTLTVPTWSGGGGGGDCGGGSIVSSCGGSSDTYTPSCPGGYTYYSGMCYPNSSCTTTDTNGSGKGGVVTTCTDPSIPNTPGGGSNVNPQTSSCTVNGETVAHGSSYTFYTQGNVPYGSSCSSVAYERVCNNGVFDGNDSGFSRCVVDDAPQIAPITITATPPIVRYGGSTTITWDGANAEACTITGYGLSNVTGVTGSAPVSNVIGESVYTLFCTLGPNTRSASTTLKVLPRTQET